MKQIKCDRCGSVEELGKHFTESFVIRSKNERIGLDVNNQRFKDYINLAYFDLCPDCQEYLQEDIESFLKGDER